MSAATADERPRPHPAVETAYLAPEAVLWDGRDHKVLHLNPSASAVWLCVDGELTAQQIAAELSDIFDAPLEVLRRDVDNALAEFVRLGLLDGHDHEHDNPVEEARDEGVVVLERPPDP